MGGCCCCSARRTTSNAPSICYFVTSSLNLHPEDLEENEPLSSTRGLLPAVPDTLISDSRQAPNVRQPRGHNLPINTLSARDSVMDHLERPDSCDGLKGSECKSFSDFQSDSPNVKKKLSSLEDSVILVTDDEDVCPTCLEEYDAENPRIMTKCKHHFHLSCILEWFERSNTCAICDRVMEIDNMALFDQSL